jgi:hypothetical protein
LLIRKIQSWSDPYRRIQYAATYKDNIVVNLLLIKIIQSWCDPYKRIQYGTSKDIKLLYAKMKVYNRLRIKVIDVNVRMMFETAISTL